MSRQKAQQFLTEALNIKLPYFSMGKIDSLDLFGPTELMILQLYKHNKSRWSVALDIGANLGLHSILMARLGWTVDAYEPDPGIFKMLVANLAANKSRKVTAHEAAVHATTQSHMNFVRVHNNLTGSHLEGFKDSYGPRDTIIVNTVNCADLWNNHDFAKIDSEGNEAELSKTMTEEQMKWMSCVMEVRNETNAAAIFLHFQSIGVPIWAQKVDWQRVKDVSEMPKMNREGSIFVGHEAPWK
jgi:FkbM family methyltransferase